MPKRGRKQSAEHKAKRLEALKRYYADPANRRKQSKKQREVWSDPELRAKHRKIMSRPEVSLKLKKGSLGRENLRFSLGRTYIGPLWWLTFRDFVLLGCHLYEIQYMRVSLHIRKVIAENGLERRDLVIWLNFIAGHNQWEIAEKFNISREEVQSILKKIEKVWPGCYQDDFSLPAHLLSYDQNEKGENWSEWMNEEATTKF